MSVPFCCILFNWMWDGEKLTKIYDSPETSVTQHCFPTMGQKQHPLRSYLRATQRRSWNLRSFSYVLWVSMLFSSHPYPCHWPLIPPSHIKLDHPPSAPCSKLTKRAVLHMTNLLLKTECVFLLTTAQQSSCNPAFQWLVSTWVFYTSPYSSIKW